MPPLLTEVDLSIVENECIVSIELSENVSEIGSVLGVHLSIRNIVLPQQCKLVGEDVIKRLTDVRAVMPDEDDDAIFHALRHRFDDFPVHKICYYQAYIDNETVLRDITREISNQNATGKQQDCLGMTSLHILACSTKQSIGVYRLLIEKYPETLIMKDRWGDIPLLYAFWCNAPTVVLDLLVESYISLYPKYEFHWGGMFVSLVKFDVPLANIQKLVNTQQSRFPNQEYNSQPIIELARHDAAKFHNHRITDIKTFRYLLRASITRRLGSLDIEICRIDLEKRIDSFPDKTNLREDKAKELYSILATHESIKEGTSILELALWKAKIDDICNENDGDVSYRDQCRVNSGADIVIPNVLSYLLPKFYEDW